jgi:hypothetical protein
MRVLVLSLGVAFRRCNSGRCLTNQSRNWSLSQRTAVRPVTRTPSWVHESQHVNCVSEGHVHDEVREPTDRMSASHVSDAPKTG